MEKPAVGHLSAGTPDITCAQVRSSAAVRFHPLTPSPRRSNTYPFIQPLEPTANATFTINQYATTPALLHQRPPSRRPPPRRLPLPTLRTRTPSSQNPQISQRSPTVHHRVLTTLAPRLPISALPKLLMVPHFPVPTRPPWVILSRVLCSSWLLLDSSSPIFRVERSPVWTFSRSTVVSMRILFTLTPYVVPLRC